MRFLRPKPDKSCATKPGHIACHRQRTLTGTFGAVAIRVPRARLAAAEGGTREWKSSVIPAYQRRTRQAEALIAGACLSGTNTRRVRRALAALFGGTIGKDIVSRAWRKVATDWQAWNRRDLSAEPVVRLILDGTGGQGPARPEGDGDLAAGGTRMRASSPVPRRMHRV